MSDEINEKSIGDIIQYYDDKADDFAAPETDEPDEEEQEKAGEAPQNEKEQELPEPEREDAEAEQETEEEPDTGEDAEEYGTEDGYYTDEYDEFYDAFDDEEDYKISTKTLTVTAVVIVAVVAIAALFSFSGDDGVVGRYKQNVIKNVGNIVQSMGIGGGKAEESPETDAQGAQTIEYGTQIRGSSTVPIENASAQFAKYKNGIICAGTNNMKFIDSSGAVAWETNTVIVNPLIRTGGNYILLTEKNGTRMCLYSESENIYDITIEDKIINCSVSSNGDVAAVTEKTGYKGAVEVFNKEGIQIFSWASGGDNIICADISPKSRRVAAALLNTDDRAKSTLKIFDIKETDAIASTVFEDTILFDVRFSGNTLNAFGDNSMIGMNSNGKLLFDKRFDEADFVHYLSDGEGTNMLVFDSANMPVINLYTKRGKLKEQIVAETLPEVIGIHNGYIAYNSGRTVIAGRAGGKNMTRFNADLDIKKLFLVSEKTFMIVYSNSVETVTME